MNCFTILADEMIQDVDYGTVKEEDRETAKSIADRLGYQYFRIVPECKLWNRRKVRSIKLTFAHTKKGLDESHPRWIIINKKSVTFSKEHQYTPGGKIYHIKDADFNDESCEELCRTLYDDVFMMVL